MPLMKIPLPENIEMKQDLDHSLIIKRTDGIIELRCADVVVYTSDKIKQNHDCLERFAGGKKALVLTIAGIYTHVMPEARAYTARGHHRHFVAAEAFLVTSFPQWVLALVYTAINRPIVPANFFLLRHKDNAEKWLRKFEKTT